VITAEAGQATRELRSPLMNSLLMMTLQLTLGPVAG